MIAGLRGWRDAAGRRAAGCSNACDHDGWSVEQVDRAAGRGRLRVRGPAKRVRRRRRRAARRQYRRVPHRQRRAGHRARDRASTPWRRRWPRPGCRRARRVLVDSAERAAGWAMFADPRLALAVARGSGPAVAQLGAVARQAGVPVSLHGTGGAWIIADVTRRRRRASPRRSQHSLDRKVCNTLNVCCIVARAPANSCPSSSPRCGARASARHGCKLHVAEASAAAAAWLGAPPCAEPRAIEEPWPSARRDARPRMGVGGDAGGHPGGRRRRRRGRRPVQPPQPALRRQSLIAEDAAAHERFYAARRRALRRRRLHPLGGRPVRPQPARTGPLELAARPAVRPRRRAERRRRATPSAPACARPGSTCGASTQRGARSRAP